MKRHRSAVRKLARRVRRLEDRQRRELIALRHETISTMTHLLQEYSDKRTVHLLYAEDITPMSTEG